MEAEFMTYLTATAERRNLSKATDYLFVSQFTLSQFLAREEQELGAKLVSRNHSGLTFTHAGKLYEETCRNMMGLQDSLYKKLSGIEQSKTGYISVGIMPQWRGEMFTEIYPISKQKHLSYLANLLEDVIKPLLEQVVKGTLDIAILTVADDAPASLPSVSVSREEFMFVVSVSLGKMPDCRRRPGTVLKALDISKVKSENFIIPCPGVATRDTTSSVSEQYRILPRIICEVSNHPFSLKMAADGLRATVIPLSYVDSNPHISYFSIGGGIFWNMRAVAKHNFKFCEPDHYLMDLMGEYFVGERMGN